VTAAAQRELLTTFTAAARSGDMAALERLFAADVISYSDGGGIRQVSRFPVVGALRVAKFLRAFAARFWVGVDVASASMNGRPAALLSRDGTVFAVLALSASAEGIDQVLWMMNPEKIATIPGSV
jgi:RNA polymerase sigma-70 factor (ECF subfamily)